MRDAGVAGIGETVTAEQQRDWAGFNGTADWTVEQRAAARAHIQCLLKVEEETGLRP
jgi:hypothetical protein